MALMFGINPADECLQREVRVSGNAWLHQ